MITIKLPGPLVRLFHRANGPYDTVENIGNSYQFKLDVLKYESQRAYLLGSPYEVFRGEKNTLTPAGRQMIWKCLTGQASAVDFYSAGNASIFVGDSATASPASSGQPFNLLGANVAGQAVDASSGQSVVGSDGQTVTLTYTATFDINAANFTWREAGLCNSSTIGGVPDLTTLPGAGTLLNRYVPSSGVIGIKQSGLVWVASMSFILAPAGA